MFNHNSTSQTSPIADGAAHSADAAIESTKRVANDLLDSVRNTSHQVQESALRASKSTVQYIKEEPVKSILIAAATGAALMALVGLMSRTHART